MVQANLYHLYFSSFHFKRQRQFIDRMKIVPDNLADRLEGLFHVEHEEAVSEIFNFQSSISNLCNLQLATCNL